MVHAIDFLVYACFALELGETRWVCLGALNQMVLIFREVSSYVPVPDYCSLRKVFRFANSIWLSESLENLKLPRLHEQRLRRFEVRFIVLLRELLLR